MTSGAKSLVETSYGVVGTIMELNIEDKTGLDSVTATENHVMSSEGTAPREVETRQENQRRKAFKAIKLKSTSYHTKSKGLKEPLTQQAKGSEDNLKGWQTNHQKRILNNPIITYGSIQSGNSRQIGITQATNLQTQEVQGVSKEKGSRLLNIASTI